MRYSSALDEASRHLPFGVLAWFSIVFVGELEQASVTFRAVMVGLGPFDGKLTHAIAPSS